MRVYEDICDMIEEELEDITKSRKLNPDTLEVIGESVDIIKDITTIKAMKEASYDNGTSRDGGYSNRMYYDDDYTMARGGRGDSRMTREGRGGYTRHDEKEMLEEKLDELKHQLNQMR